MLCMVLFTNWICIFCWSCQSYCFFNFKGRLFVNYWYKGKSSHLNYISVSFFFYSLTSVGFPVYFDIWLKMHLKQKCSNISWYQGDKALWPQKKWQLTYELYFILNTYHPSFLIYTLLYNSLKFIHIMFHICWVLTINVRTLWSDIFMLIYLYHSICWSVSPSGLLYVHFRKSITRIFCCKIYCIGLFVHWFLVSLIFGTCPNR